jgi:hypothetical protein
MAQRLLEREVISGQELKDLLGEHSEVAGEARSVRAALEHLRDPATA